MTTLSVIICTYKPDLHILERCLAAIEKAAAKHNPYEILLIDNNSPVSLSSATEINRFLQKMPQARVMNETEQGLTPARLRGIKEAKGDILLYIDDDNIIAEDFFSVGMDIAAKYPFIGSWSGQVNLEFETTAPEWTRRYWGLLVYRQFTTDIWSNLPYLPDSMPCGAGLFVRNKVAKHYLDLHETGKRKIQLDRNGQSLFSGGDNDLAASACDMGLGVGLFHQLQLVHYIPAFRTEKNYLLKLAEGIAASTIVFKSFRQQTPPPPTFKNKMANTFRTILKTGTDKEFYKAVLKGEAIGRNIVLNNTNKPA